MPMDPTANLREQLKLANRLAMGTARNDSPEARLDDAIRLADLVLALDQWLTKGGFSPERWAHLKGGAQS
jgi:hypothetical protein